MKLNLIQQMREFRAAFKELNLTNHEIEKLFGNGRVSIECDSQRQAELLLQEAIGLGATGHVWTSEGGHGWPDTEFCLISVIDDLNGGGR